MNGCVDRCSSACVLNVYVYMCAAIQRHDDDKYNTFIRRKALNGKLISIEMDFSFILDVYVNGFGLAQMSETSECELSTTRYGHEMVHLYLKLSYSYSIHTI